MRATASNAPVSNSEIRAALAILCADVATLREQNNKILAALALLAENDRDLGAMVTDLYNEKG